MDRENSAETEKSMKELSDKTKKIGLQEENVNMEEDLFGDEPEPEPEMERRKLVECATCDGWIVDDVEVLIMNERCMGCGKKRRRMETLFLGRFW